MIVVNPTGGGLSNGKLAQATATPADVLSGKTFFAGNSVLKVGTRSSGIYKASAGSFSTPTQYNSGSVNCGFKPIYVSLWTIDSNDVAIIYDVNSLSGNTGNQDMYSANITITNNGFTYSKLYVPSYSDSSCYYFAIG